MVMGRWIVARWLVALAPCACILACSGNRSGAGPNYSTTPCVDNCGNDVQCQTRCTDVGPNSMPPIGVYRTK
jgi:hypothetical protein